MSMIIAKRDTHIVIRNKRDEYVHRPNDSYNILKYESFGGNRVMHTFDNDPPEEEMEL